MIVADDSVASPAETGARATGLRSVHKFALLSAEQCGATIKSGRRKTMEKARIASGYDGTRVGRVAWFVRAAATEWLFSAIERCGQAYAKENGIDVEGLCGTLQFVEYPSGGFFDWHVDIGQGDAIFRKVTVCVQLSSANDYTGGELEMVGESYSILRRARGSATIFPSVLGHRLTEVTSGTRYALVAWMLGPAYR